jgi:ADP-ribosylglycohydrolase
MGSCAIALATAILADRDVGTIAMSSLLGNIIPILLDSVVKSKLQDVQKALHEKIDPKVALASLGTSGYVPESIGAAFYCLLATSSFEDAVVMAVKGGGDTDTIAAMTGAMAGTYYGLDGIPEHYKSVENFELLKSLDRELINIDI